MNADSLARSQHADVSLSSPHVFIPTGCSLGSRVKAQHWVTCCMYLLMAYYLLKRSDPNPKRQSLQTAVLEFPFLHPPNNVGYTEPC